MDGRRETVYSERVNEDHQRFYAGDPTMLDYPDRIGADHVWLPSRLKMADALVRTAGSRSSTRASPSSCPARGPPIPLRPIPRTEQLPVALVRNSVLVVKQRSPERAFNAGNAEEQRKPRSFAAPQRSLRLKRR